MPTRISHGDWTLIRLSPHDGIKARLYPHPSTYPTTHPQVRKTLDGPVTNFLLDPCCTDIRFGRRLQDIRGKVFAINTRAA